MFVDLGELAHKPGKAQAHMPTIALISPLL